jgi:heme-degrading monooxygenase HmoA
VVVADVRRQNVSWLRVVTYQLPATDADAAIESIKASSAGVLSVLEAQPGFGSAYWAESPEDNTVSAISYWGSLEAIEAAEASLKKIQSIRDATEGLLEVHNIGLFPVPAISMWSSDEAEEDGNKRRLLSGRFGRKRH